MRSLRFGSGVRCECCGKTSRRFGPAGDPVREHARCPHCAALERRRVLWPHLETMLGRGARVLHFAPEPIIATSIADLPVAEYVLADLNPDAGHLVAGMPITAADISAQPWDDDSFDIAVVRRSAGFRNVEVLYEEAGAGQSIIQAVA